MAIISAVPPNLWYAKSFKEVREKSYPLHFIHKIAVFTAFATIYRVLFVNSCISAYCSYLVRSKDYLIFHRYFAHVAFVSSLDTKILIE